MARRANKKDTNHTEITDMITIMREKHGFPVSFTDTHMIKGFCDFTFSFGGDRLEDATANNSDWVIGCMGITILVEVKGRKKKITDAEDEYLNRCFGSYLKVETFEELIEHSIFFCWNEKQILVLKGILELYDEYYKDRKAPIPS